MLIKDKDILADEPVKTLQKKEKKPSINKESMHQAWGDVFDYYIRGVTEKYLLFHGRASRLEFWGFMLVSGLLFILLYGLGKYAEIPLLPYYYGLATLLPTFGVFTRRLHDINKKTLWYALSGLLTILSAIFIGAYAFILILAWAIFMINVLFKETDTREGFFGDAGESDEIYGDDNIRILRKFRLITLCLWCIVIGITFVSFDEWRVQAEYIGTKENIMEQIETAGRQANMTPEQIEAAQHLMTQTLKAWSGKTVNPDDIEKAIQQSLKAFDVDK